MGHLHVRYKEMGPSSHVFEVIAWISDRFEAPREKALLLRECALALEEANISFGQTTNLSAASGLNLRTDAFAHRSIYRGLQFTS